MRGLGNRGQNCVGLDVGVAAVAAAELADDDGVAELVLNQIVGGLDGRLVETHQELVSVLAQVTSQALVVGDGGVASEESSPGEGRIGEFGAAGAKVNTSWGRLLTCRGNRAAPRTWVSAISLARRSRWPRHWARR
jgi:hypothetical protein